MLVLTAFFTELVTVFVDAAFITWAPSLWLFFILSHTQTDHSMTSLQSGVEHPRNTTTRCCVREYDYVHNYKSVNKISTIFTE